MTCLTVRWASMDSGAEKFKNMPAHMDQIVSCVHSVRGSLSFSNQSSYEIKRRLQNISNELSRQSQTLRHMANVLEQARSRYAACEGRITGEMSGSGADLPDSSIFGSLAFTVLNDRLKNKDGSKNLLNELFLGILGEEGAAGKTAAAWLNLLDEEKSALEKGIGVGKSGAGIAGIMASWMKNGMKESEIAEYLFGWNTKKIPEDMAFWKALKGEAGEYLLENGDDMTKAAKAGDGLAVGAKWLGGVLSFAGSAVDNYEEYKSGEISGGRAVAETVTETAVDIGSDMLITAGVTAGAAALGVTAAPAVVVGGVAVAAKWGLDCLCESLWDKSFTETVSDGLLDMGEAVVSGAGELVSDVASGAGKVCEAVADSVGKAATAVTDGVKSFWKSATSWAFG